MQTLPNSSISSVDNLMREGRLESILKKCQILQRLQQLLIQAAPELETHCQIANFSESKLLLEVESAAWGMRLGFLQTNLLITLRSFPEFNKLCVLDYYIRPKAEINKTPARKKLTLSNENILLLKEMAVNITDENLRNALLKLANKV